MDLEKDEVGQPDPVICDRLFLVFSGDLVWLRVLPLHGLALAGEDETGFV